MKITGTFNNWNIVSVPTFPGFQSVDFDLNDSVSEYKSIFTGQSQYQAWPGADFWTGKVTLPPMQRHFASQWIAFLMGLRGQANVFMLGDPLAPHPQGMPAGAPVANSTGTNTNQSMQTQLVTRGWAPSRFRLLLANDYIQVGNRLYSVVDDQVQSDSSGNATINIWPSIREPIADATPLVLNNPQGLFRLASNKRSWNVGVSRTYGISFDVKEAR